MELSYTLAFTTGFLGGFGHCIGMCGPIITAYTFHSTPAGFYPSPVRNVLPHLFYNTGRITTYMFAGAVMGLTGSFVNTAGRLTGFQNSVALIAGLLMLIMGIRISGITGGITWLEKRNGLIIRAGKGLAGGETLWMYYPLGALFGFLPCGLSYSAFLAAAGSGSMLSGMLTTFFFGLGTLPALLLFGLAAGYLSNKLKGLLYRLSGVIVILTGGYFIVRAL
ncbi:MAG: sulfite exporter TauE/SafE family protein [Nitrospirae bacterium]|nr:sulfite exporter TauE/SafE family protein [Nitrospirota bacterium]